MNLNELLAELSQQGIKVWANGDQLGIRAPKGVLTAELRQILSERKPELLALLRQHQKEKQASELALEAVSRAGNLPLSFEQERLFQVAQLVSDRAIHHIPQLLKLSGPLNIPILQNSLDQIVLRHEALRTSFAEVAGKPIQRVAIPSAVALPMVDLSSLPPTEQDTRIAQLSEQQARQPFALAQGPLWRCQLLKLSESEHRLSLVFHHLIADLLSVALFVKELALHYEALLLNQPSPLPPLAIQYGDFAAWQQQWLQSDGLSDQLAYWQRQLAEAMVPVILPSDRPRPLLRSFRGSHYGFKLSVSLWTALQHLSRQAGVTPFMTLLAAYKLLLHKYSGQEDLCLGSPIAGRNHPQLQSAIGFFAYPLVLRSNLAGNPTFLQFLARIREVVIEAYAQQKISWGKIVEYLPAEQQQQPNPFSVLFSLVNQPLNSLEVASLTLTPINEAIAGMADVDLFLSMYEVEDTLQGVLQYSLDLFEAATIEQMARHFQTLLEAIVAHPDQFIGQLSLLSAPERQQVLGGWNDTGADYPQQCLHQLIEERVEQMGEAVAIVFAEQILTYRQLNERANQLAHYLQGLGIGTEVLVGICLERSLEMVIGLLAILKAGGAYVPLDPTYPPERLAYLLQDAQVSVLLTQQKWLTLLSEFPGQVLCLDSQWELMAGQPSDNPCSGSNPDNLAYVIYTSGSTGNPKGAMNTHRGIVNRLCWMQDAYQLMTDDHVLQKTPFSFDVSVWEFFWPLLAGARLVVAQPGGHQDSAYLVKLIAQQQITTLHFVPSMLQIFLEEKELSGLQSLRRVICSGEALPLALQQRFFDQLPACDLHNLYGPTEAAIDVTFWPCEKESPLQIVPIGRPIANTQIYILDRYLQPVPIGATGELHIGGVGVARGYLNRPALTTEKFIADPFQSANAEAAFLYKTGDLARYLPNGAIEYLGRIDHQVKLRGFRIELGEIEAILCQHLDVREAVVIDREDSPGHKFLVAYWVAILPAEPPLVEDLRQFLQTKLPEYMVPSAWVQLSVMPLTPNGKVDRRALPKPTSANRQAQTDWVAPRTPTEEKIAAISAEVLRLERVSIEANFFELGGNSLLAIQIISRVREAFTVELPLRSLFEAPTVAQLAQTIEELKANSPSDPAPALVKVSREARRLKLPQS